MANLVIVDESTVAATVGGAALLAESVAKEFRLLCPEDAAANIGLSTKAGSSYAACAIILTPGQGWLETTAAGEAWYVYAQTGTINCNLMALS